MSKQEVEIEQEPDLIDSIIPSMNVSLPSQPLENEKQPMVSEDMLLGIYSEILTNLREDRNEMGGYVTNLADMVFNDNDGDFHSKEALVNLIKTKSEIGDKMAKIADLMTRVVLKERDTFPRYLAAHQNNTINIGNSDKRELLQQIDRLQQKKKKE